MTGLASQPNDAFGVVLPPDPYPGLRPFEKHEWAVFFGRERMTDAVIERLVRRQFIFVHGDSGCGKSSLIKAGVFARLEQENARGGVSWRTCEMQPRVAPLDALATALASLAGTRDRSHVLDIRRALNFGADAPAHVARLVRRGDLDHVCLLLDQFEELFAFVRRGGRDEASLFVQFLVSLVKSPPPGLYAVATMRSEFLGACAQFPGLAEAVNDVQYLLPRMAPLDLLRAIREPAPAYRGTVCKALAQRLIADAGGTQDQLPLIQHGLLVLYKRKVRPVIGGETPKWRLELEDYTSDPARLADMLSGHADQVARKADPDGRIVETVFRALTEINADGQAIRRPQSFGALLAITGVAAPVLQDVLRAFRAEGASFLRPYATVAEGDGASVARDLLDTDVVDISHEALIRSWRRIADPTNGWLAREFQDGLIWKSLLVQAASFEENESNVLSRATVLERQRWLAAHTAAWAERYGGGWDRVADLVAGSVSDAERQQRKERRAARKQALLATALAMLFFLGLVYFIGQNKRTAAALTEAYRASAGSLWNRLDFPSATRTTDDELNALWEIAAGSPDVRAVFAEQLLKDPVRIAQLGRRPAPIVRAVALKWPSDAAQASFTFAITSVKAADTGQLAGLGTAALTLGGSMEPGAAQAVLPATMSAFRAETEPNRAAAVAQGLQGLAPHLGADEANAAVLAIIEKIQAMTVAGTATTTAMGRHAFAVAGLAKRLTPTQADHVLDAILAISDKSFANYVVPCIAPLVERLDRDGVRKQFAHALADPPAAERASGPLSVEALIAARASRRGLSEVGQRAGARLTEADAQQFYPAWFAGLKREVGKLTGNDASKVGIGFVSHLGPEQLTPAAAWLAATPIPSHVNDELLTSLVAEIAKKLSLDEVRALAGRGSPPVNGFDARLRLQVAARGTPADAAEGLRVAQWAIQSTFDPKALAVLSGPIRAIVEKTDGADAVAALKSVLAALPDADDFDQRNAFVALVRDLAERVPAAQVTETLPAVLAAFGSSRNKDLTAAAQALAGKATPAQRLALIGAAASTLDTVNDSARVEAAAATLRLFAESLPPDRVEPVLHGFFRQLANTPGRAAGRSLPPVPLIQRLSCRRFKPWPSRRLSPRSRVCSSARSRRMPSLPRRRCRSPRWRWRCPTGCRTSRASARWRSSSPLWTSPARLPSRSRCSAARWPGT